MQKQVSNQLVFAREYRGYTQTQLSSNIDGLSQSNLSKFEKGIGHVSNDILIKVFDFLNFPRSFFNKSIHNISENAHYRKRSGISKKERINIEKIYRLIGYIIDEVNDTVAWPEFKLKSIDLEEGFSPEYVAGFIRRMLRILPNQPVKDIFTILEYCGIIIVEIDANLKFDGVSFITDRYTYPVIVINKNFSNDRKRFTIAHELGHLLMHIIDNPAIPNYRNDKVKENEANRFASEFLFPMQEAKRILPGLMLSHLGPLKKNWLISMASIIRRAYDLGIIDQNKYRYFNIELSRSGQKRNENTKVEIDSPSCFKNMYLHFKNNLNYSDEDLSKAFSLPIDIINNIFNPYELRVI